MLLLKQRVSLMHPRQLYKLFQTILRHIQRRDNSKNPVDKGLIKTISFLLQLKIFKHIVSKNHTKNCEEYHQKGNSSKVF